MKWAAALIALAAAGPSLAAQSVAQRVDAVRDGTVRLSYAARPGVCGNDDGGVSITGRHGDGGQYWGGRVCESGPVRVSVGRSEGRTINVRKYVGGRLSASSDVTDLGVVDATEAARYLLSVAPSIGGRNANEAISAAAIADATTIAPELTRLMQNGDAPLDARKDALFWLGESEIGAAEFARLYDRSQPYALREQWTFVLSQRHEDPALDKLIEIARGDSDVEIRKRAMFWIGQSRDPKAIQFLHDLILR
ncbi:MAG TPA: HEAT repeat domain-containing protein [Gemmatimonadaceae bacterium]